MALISARFAGVLKLEQCAVDDSAHLVIGSIGPHVALMQQALTDLGFPVGSSGADGVYGNDTADAVVEYKTARGIRNAQDEVDNIVGKRTIVTLDAEIAAFDDQSGRQSQTPARLHTVTFWINAFIPDPSLSPFVLPAPGASEGQSMIVAPVIPPRFFLGDNRGFSDDIAASARIHSVAVISGLDTSTPTLRESRHECGESIEVDAGGNIIARATADTPRCRFLHLRGNQSVDPNGGVVEDDPSPLFVQLDYEAAANLPLLFPSPDIDMVGTLQIDRENYRVGFVGAIDAFPAFEAYVRVNSGPPMVLFRERPVAPMDLPGDVKRHAAGSVSFIPM